MAGLFLYICILRSVLGHTADIRFYKGGTAMSIPFQDSETAKNLLRAFAGESQARNRYDFAANLCQKQELQAMAFIFQATASRNRPTPRFSGTICKP